MASHTISLSADKIAAYHASIPGFDSLPIEIPQAQHRINLVQSWKVAPGASVLELGCGQGTCTAVLAEAVGEHGRVDAVDPAPGTYGAPLTLAQAQAHLSAGPLGARIRWHEATPEAFLAGRPGEQWDVAVLAHCIWYFARPGVLRDVLVALRGRAKRVVVAEYAFRATDAAAFPHVLAALARATLECHKAESEENIQTPLSPRGIAAIAKEAGWTVQEESHVVPVAGLMDGQWETGTVKAESFLEEIEAVESARVKVALQSAREAVVQAVEAVGGVKNVKTMDVWTATFAETA